MGDPTHLVGRPAQEKIPYRRASRDAIQAHFGESAAQRMGKSWARETPWGYSMVIGELLQRQDGQEEQLDFEKAKEACLNLNPPEKRAEVQSAFTEREEKLHELRGRYKEKLEYQWPDQLSVEEQVAFNQAYQKHPIPGCYLPSREEWKLLESDFGRQKDQYIPQVLP